MRLAVLVPLSLLYAPVAGAVPFGPTASVGLCSTPEIDRGAFTLKPMTGPVAQLGIAVGGWANSEFMLQFNSAAGDVSFPGQPLQASDRVRMILAGYQFTLDIFGKQGLHGFTPYVGGGLLFGMAHVEVQSSRADPSLQQALESSGAQAQQRDGPVLELHAVVGLRYRIVDGFAVRAELGDSTNGGFFGTLQPKLRAEYTF